MHRGAPDFAAIREVVDLLGEDEPYRLWGLAPAAISKSSTGDFDAAADDLNEVAGMFAAAGDTHPEGGWQSFAGDLYVAAGRVPEAIAVTHRRASWQRSSTARPANRRSWQR